jgi:branched-chain amino acid transport system substrate-binding protein
MNHVKRPIGILTTFFLALVLMFGQLCTKAFATSKEMKIGFVLSMTGSAAAYGATQKKGAELAVEEINSAAGSTGIKIVAIFEDDASVPQQGINVFKKFINADKVSLIIGPTLSNTAQVTDRIAQQARMPVLGISNTAKGITEIGNYIFRDSLTESVVIPHTIKVAKQKFGLHKVAVLYGNDDAFTKGGYDAFKKALAEAGIAIVTEQTFAKGDRDFSPQLTEIKSKNPDAIIISALVEEASGIVIQARQLGIPASVPIIGGNGFNSPALIKNAGEAAEGVMMGAAWNASSNLPLNKKFVEAFSAKYGNPPDQFAAQAYAGVFIAHKAIVLAASPKNHEAIRNAMAQIKDLDTVLGIFSFTPERDAGCTPVVQIVNGGKFVVLGD